MIDIGTSIIIGSIISLIGIIIVIQLNNHNWFKKQIFKDNKSQLKAINNIKLDQLRKELKLESRTQDSNIDLSGLIGNLTGNEEEDNPVVDLIKNVVETNPELVDGLIKRFGPELIKRFIPTDQQDKYI